jgi:hypothetical protein
MPSRRRIDPPGASLLRVWLLAVVLVNFLLWGIAVGIFHGGSGLENAPTIRTRSSLVIFVMGVVVFVTSSVTTLPQMGAVFAHLWANHAWYLLLVIAVNGLLAIFILWLTKVEQELNSGRVFKRSRR